MVDAQYGKTGEWRRTRDASDILSEQLRAPRICREPTCPMNSRLNITRKEDPPSSLLDQWGVTVQALHNIAGRAEEPSYEQDMMNLVPRLCLKCEIGAAGAPISSLPRRAQSARRRRRGRSIIIIGGLQLQLQNFAGQSERAMGLVDKTERAGKKPSSTSAGRHRHSHWQPDRELPRFAFKFFEGPRLT